MKNSFIFQLATWSLLLNIAFADESYNFESYPAIVNKANVTAKPLWVSKQAKKYKTTILQEANEPANFAGHYRVVIWGCGTDCRGFVILDKQTGRVYELPDVEYVAGVMGNSEDRLSFRLNSRLFIITGIKNDDENQEGKFYYLWEKNHLKLLKKENVKKESFS